MTDPRILLGETIRKRRNELGLSQAALAEKASLEATYISYIETGKQNIGITSLVKIAQALHARVTDLVKPIDQNLVA